MASKPSAMEVRRKLTEDQLAAMPVILEKVYAKQDYRRAAYNVDVVARALLLRGMTSARLEGDFQSARADFAEAAARTRQFGRALEGVRQNGRQPGAAEGAAYLDIQDFEIPLFVCVLAHDWPQTEAVARTTRDPLVRELEDPVVAQMVRLLAAFVLDERAVFAGLKASYDKSKKSAFTKYFVHYVDMYDSIINRDQARYDELAAKADSLYRARANDRKLGESRPEYGGLTVNAEVLDFIALAIAIVAVKRRMRPGKVSDIVPEALIAGA